MTSYGRAEHPSVRHVLGNRQSVCVARVTAQQKVERDAHIVADRSRGLTWATIEARHGVGERQCRTIWAERLREISTEPVDVREALREAITQLDAAIEDCALLAESTSNDSVRLGAIKARLAAMGERDELLRLSGLLPFDARAVRTEAELRDINDLILGLFDKHGLGDDAKRELEEGFEAGLAGRNGQHAVGP
jgi:hypothetical protein